MLRRAKRDSVRPYDLRVVRDHGGGLWSLEGNDGQTYLAVLSYENTEHRRNAEKLRQADGSAYHPGRMSLVRGDGSSGPAA